MLYRAGRIELDNSDNNNRFKILKGAIRLNIKPIFDKLHDFIIRFPDLKSATGMWYINYCIEKRVIFFKVEPTPNKDKPYEKEGIYISVCDEDYDILQQNLQKYVLPKPPGRSKHGNWKRHAVIRTTDDLGWACKLVEEIYRIVKRKRYSL